MIVPRRGASAVGARQLVTGALAGTVAATLRAQGRTVTVLDSTGARDKAALLDGVARDLALPEWFGRNWDALVDALRDAPAFGAGACVVWCGVGELATTDPDALATAIEIVHDAAVARGALVVVVTTVALAGLAPL